MADERFDFSDKYSFRLPPESAGENWICTFQFVDRELGLRFKDWKLMNSRNGIFASSPSFRYTPKGESKEKYVNYIDAAYDEATGTRDEYGQQWLEDLAQAAHAAFEASGLKRSSRGRSSGRSGGPQGTRSAPRASATRSGRGPVKPRVEDLDPGDDDGLPF